MVGDRHSRVGDRVVYRIVSRKFGSPVGSYCRAFHDDVDFESAEDARTANWHGLFKDRETYRIVKVRVTEVIEDEDVP